MIKNILNVEKIKVLEKADQKHINGGSLSFDCIPQIIDCDKHRDCCSGKCHLHWGICAF
ncbi:MULTISPECIES: hypothetical protein [Aquimarina]|uniref:hypothetical protein n=1 Tax=Aquimarina TaxID=290174 RepID=UPI00131EEE55|nr:MULTISPECIES: hypothetical protein [Aquimarina]